MKKENTAGRTRKMKEYTYDSITYTVKADVYKPAEDSFLLARILEDSQTAGNLLEIGTGCGLLSLIAAEKGSNVLATDINPHAAINSQLNARSNALDSKIEVLRCNIAQALYRNPIFDHIIFNPPYLPVEESSRDWLSRSWAGGTTGIEFAEKVIAETSAMLKPEGDFTFIVSSENSLRRVRSFVEGKGMRLKVMDSASFFFEKIFAVSAKRSQ